MIINLDVDVRPLIRKLDQLRGDKGVAYGVTNAINRVAYLAQSTVREHVQERMEVRKPEFTLRQAAIVKPKADPRQGRAFAEISVGQKPRLLLSIFEAGGERPKKGETVSVALTGEAARPTWAQVIPEQLRTKQLGFKRKRTKKPGPARYVGKLGTYTVPGVGIFQRPPGATESSLIYAFKPHVELSPELDFVVTVRRIANAWFKRFMEQDLAIAIARAEARKR